jgi:hypothetical protein
MPAAAKLEQLSTLMPSQENQNCLCALLHLDAISGALLMLHAQHTACVSGCVLASLGASACV